MDDAHLTILGYLRDDEKWHIPLVAPHRIIREALRLAEPARTRPPRTVMTRRMIASASDADLLQWATWTLAMNPGIRSAELCKLSVDPYTFAPYVTLASKCSAWFTLPPGYAEAELAKPPEAE